MHEIQNVVQGADIVKFIKCLQLSYGHPERSNNEIMPVQCLPVWKQKRKTTEKMGR